MEAPKAAIVSTIRLPGGLRSVQVLESFVFYHLKKGFQHIFLFFDHPQDPAIPFARERQVLGGKVKARFKERKEGGSAVDEGVGA
jgi:hypothetical protein